MRHASKRIVGDLGTELDVVLRTLHTRQARLRQRCGPSVTFTSQMGLWTSRSGTGTRIALRVAVSVNGAVHEGWYERLGIVSYILGNITSHQLTRMIMQ